jgi:hypothetical protein
VPPLILRLVTWLRMSFSDPLDIRKQPATGMAKWRKPCDSNFPLCQEPDVRLR